MKRKWKIAAVVACAFFLLTAAYAAASGAGSQNDPLVTLSYLTNIFAPKVEQLADQTVQEYQEENREELEELIDEWDWEIQQAIDEAEVSGGKGGVTYQLVTLESGQILTLEEGCEVFLRSGKAKWTAESLLMDTTAGSGLASGGQLAANHLYMALAEGFISVVAEQTPTTTPAPSQTTGTVTAGPLNVRSGPDSTYTAVGTLNEGDKVTILNTIDGWHQITSGGLSGYVSADYVEVHQPEATPTPEPTPTPAVGSATFMIRGGFTIE